MAFTALFPVYLASKQFKVDTLAVQCSSIL